MNMHALFVGAMAAVCLAGCATQSPSVYSSTVRSFHHSHYVQERQPANYRPLPEARCVNASDDPGGIPRSTRTAPQPAVTPPLQPLRLASPTSGKDSPLLRSSEAADALLNEAEKACRGFRWSEAECKALAVTRMGQASNWQQASGYVYAAVGAFMQHERGKTKVYFRNAIQTCPDAVCNAGFLTTEMWELYQEVLRESQR